MKTVQYSSQRRGTPNLHLLSHPLTLRRCNLSNESNCIVCRDAPLEFLNLPWCPSPVTGIAVVPSLTQTFPRQELQCPMTNEIRPLHGYRFMHLKCITNGLVVSKETIRVLLGILDPEGVELRRARRLVRRRYSVKGPNYLWHMDSYDKLKPFGIGVNGCIDGFSRYVVWLEAYRTNNDPAVIAGYYIRSVQNYNGCPMIIRADFGTENGHVEQMQTFLRENEEEEEEVRCFQYGHSTANQRIKSWWGILRKENS